MLLFRSTWVAAEATSVDPAIFLVSMHKSQLPKKPSLVLFAANSNLD